MLFFKNRVIRGLRHNYLGHDYARVVLDLSVVSREVLLTSLRPLHARRIVFLSPLPTRRLTIDHAIAREFAIRSRDPEILALMHVSVFRLRPVLPSYCANRFDKKCYSIRGFIVSWDQI